MFLKIEIINNQSSPQKKSVFNCENNTPTAICPQTEQKVSKNLIRFFNSGYTKPWMKEKQMVVFFKLCVILGLYRLKLNLALPVSKTGLSPDPPSIPLQHSSPNLSQPV